MKIGILTLHYIPNYGAVLQCYALQEYLEQYGNVELIDYRQLEREQNFSNKGYIEFCREQKSIIGIIKLPYKCWKNRYIHSFRKQLEKFYAEKYRLTFYTQKNGLNQITKKFDAMVIGSDQVWNPKVLDNDYSLMLNFYKGLKYSYASSIGVDKISRNDELQYKKYLSEFRYISCREKTGCELVNRIFDYKICENVLDPTLLLNQEYWYTFCASQETNHEKEMKYVMLYTVKVDEYIVEFAQKLAKEKGIQLVCVASPGVYTNQKVIRKLKGVCSVSPEKWVALVKNANYIVTNSFHGVAFAINLEKQCFIHMDKNIDKNCTNSRLENIIEMFHLNDSVIEQNKSNKYCVRMNYESINQILEVKREESTRYILSMIEDIRCQIRK